MRFHLSFDYDGGHASRSFGDAVEIADSLDEAVRRIARARNLRSIHVCKRFSLGRPACDAEIIDRDFVFDVLT